MTDRTHRIVVGVDGSAASDHALDWALAEAVRGHRPVHLVHARAVNDWWLMAGAPVPQELLDTPDQILAEARERAERTAPDADLTAESPLGHATEVLVEQSATAELVVVGARGRGPARQLVLGSVSAQLARHAACPVVVVRGPVERDAAEGAPERVVVGVDGSPTAEDAIGFAFAHAATHGLGVTAVHAWEEVLVDGLPALPGSPEQEEEKQQRLHELVAEAVAPWRAKYPDVDVRERVLRGDPTQALLDDAEHTALLVVGSRGLGGFRGLLLGSVSRAVLGQADCPVAIVRPHRAD